MSKPIYIELDKAIAMMNLTFARPERITRFLELVPVADVAPVEHAHWKTGVDNWYIFCSNCKSRYYDDLTEFANYCPNCGAKMDEEE